MNLQIFNLAPADSEQFVTFWSARYSYPNPHLYLDNIGQTLTADRVWKLYQWKNGTSKISAKKKQSIQTTYIAALDKLPNLRTIDDGKHYVKELGGGGIWDIFWLHCIAPCLFPIFDQHTFRAMETIKTAVASEIPTSRDRKLQSYFDDYLPFLSKFGTLDKRNVDQALFAYGRFLKSGFARP